MDLSLSPAQELLRRTARDFLTEVSPPRLVKAMMEDERGVDPLLWNGIVRLGWPGLLIPERYGGSGGSLLDAVILFEEVGRALPPAPLFVSGVLSALVLLHAGSEAQRTALLPAIANGQAIVTLAYTEPSATWEEEGITTIARRVEGGYHLHGIKLFVPDAHLATHLLVAARLDGTVRLWLVDPASAGLRRTPLVTIAGDKQFELVLDDVWVEEAALLPGDAAARDAAFQRATIVKAAEMCGGSQKALEMAVEYAKQRIAFGRPIGAFQAIQHKAAEMVTQVDALRVLIAETAWKLDTGQPAALDVSLVKDYANDVFRFVTVEAHQIFAGIAYTMDHDLHLYFRRVKSAEAMLGDSRYHRRRMAAELQL
ncbi:MAG: acyl-CoA dehydrogenase [Dehalococcoidia bacterium]|nr:MAG: acyl-CoA dehydrogenase [Dehalococcoidia bacterium]